MIANFLFSLTVSNTSLAIYVHNSIKKGDESVEQYFFFSVYNNYYNSHLIVCLMCWVELDWTGSYSRSADFNLGEKNSKVFTSFHEILQWRKGVHKNKVHLLTCVYFYN